MTLPKIEFIGSNMLLIMNPEEFIPIELWRLIVELDPISYGDVSVLSKRHNATLRGELDYFKRLASKPKLGRYIHYWLLPNGKKHGKWIEYGESRAIRIETNYVDDVKHGNFTRYYDSGVIACIIEYKNGKKHGKMIEYYESGAIRYETNYVDGKRHNEQL